MPRNGGGVYSLPNTYEAVSGETIEAQQHNDPLEDLQQDANTARPIVAGGTGETTAAAAATALGVGAASNVTHGGLTLVSTDAGATAGPVLNLYRNSASPVASDIIGKVNFQGEDSAGNTEDYAEIYGAIDDPTSTSEDASLLFRTKVAGTMTTLLTLNASTILFRNVVVQVFTSSGTYTPTSGTKFCVIECVGGGGGSGSGDANTSNGAGGGGGGGGGYSRSRKTASDIGASQTVTIGAGGVAGSSGDGGTGGDTSVGSLVIAKGGLGGARSTFASPGNGGAGAPAGTGDVAYTGHSGGAGQAINIVTVSIASGAGGSGPFGGGAPGLVRLATGTTTGTAGSLYGGGASGGLGYNTASASAGAAGAAGLVIVTEYIG